MFKFWLLPILFVIVAVALYFYGKDLWVVIRKNRGLVLTILAALVVGISCVYLLYGFNPNFF